MLEPFQQFLARHQAPLPPQRTLLAVSGGLDSVVLLDLFVRAGLAVGIAHANFGLRGEESEGDEAFVRQLADRYGLPCFTRRFDTRALVQQEGISTQMAARALRYPWFEELRQQQGYDFIATAHHASDALETTLLNLVRGTGLAGLKGIAFRNGRLIRPLLFATRDDIARYAAQQQLSWREDSSNQSTYYRRNRLRHRVVPVLKELNPSLESTFQQTAERLRAAEALLAEYQLQWEAQAVQRQGTWVRISLAALRQCTEPAYRLAAVLGPFGFSYQQAQQVVEGLDGLTGKRFGSGTHTLLLDRDSLLLTPDLPPPQEVQLGTSDAQVAYGTLQLRQQLLPRPADLAFPTAPHTALFDADCLEYPLRLRPWQPGDWFQPLGMEGKKKKVSDLLVDLKIPRTQKDQVPVLTDRHGQLVWVVGLRADHRFRVTGTTTRLVQLTLEKGT
jgi:tRNA(Ile)-lysidine synthase